MTAVRLPKVMANERMRNVYAFKLILFSSLHVELYHSLVDVVAIIICLLEKFSRHFSIAQNVMMCVCLRQERRQFHTCNPHNISHRFKPYIQNEISGTAGQTQSTRRNTPNMHSNNNNKKNDDDDDQKMSFAIQRCLLPVLNKLLIFLIRLFLVVIFVCVFAQCQRKLHGTR